MCDSKFHVEALQELMASDQSYGFIIVDGNSCLYLVEVFVYDKANFFEKKIEIDIHHDINMDYFHLNTISYSLNCDY